MDQKLKTSKQMERHFKGVANHRRIDILLLIASEGGISVEEMSERLQTNFKTISQHARSLTQSGLVLKNYKGRKVEHVLSPYGKIFAKFVKDFRHLGSK
ncbi:MAG: winged helix-turn-helix domain-containing protein [Candidatus Liptonbacteria bacterium]